MQRVSGRGPRQTPEKVAATAFALADAALRRERRPEGVLACHPALRFRRSVFTA